MLINSHSVFIINVTNAKSYAIEFVKASSRSGAHFSAAATKLETPPRLKLKTGKLPLLSLLWLFRLVGKSPILATAAWAFLERQLMAGPLILSYLYKAMGWGDCIAQR